MKKELLPYVSPTIDAIIVTLEQGIAVDSLRKISPQVTPQEEEWINGGTITPNDSEEKDIWF